ncbi:MAG: S-layer homology domain-containing protein [Monoglobus pectinilyticus]|uniref:S-layer homology domain-containing protein n=1 Tax=Monoglobus pectinilyticus TaxID=1981510 RepID=UPI00300EB220
MRTFKRSLALVLAIAMVLTTFGMTVVSAAQYNDTEGHWAESYINTWSGYGVIQGDGGYFRPDDAITRAEVAQVTDNVISYEKIADNMFTDVSTTDWFADAVLKLVAAGTLTGNGDGTMTPNNYMTREEAMTMLARAYGLTVENTQAGITQYADYQNISDYATGYVGAMTAAGYVGGYEDGTIRPKDYISRAEFVKIIDNMIKLYITEPGSYGPEYVGGIVMIKTGGVTLNGIVAGGVVVSPQVSGDVTITGSQISGDIVNLSEKANVTSNTGNVTNPSATTKPNNIVIGGGGSGGGGNGGGPASLTVKFHYGENYGTVKTRSVTKGKKLSESSVPTPTESNWDGLWYTSKSAAEKCSGTTFDPTVSAVNKNYDLYAGHINNYDLKDVEIAVDNKTDYVNVYVGDVLTATNLAPAAAKNYVSYQWYRTKESNGTGDKISGATKSTYTAVEADKGMYLKVVVTGDGTNYNGTVSDVSTIVLAKDAPSIYPEKTTAAFGNDAATTVTLTEGQTITGVKTESGEMLTADQYTFDAETGKLTISKDYLAGLTDGQNVFTIVVSDDAAYNVTFVVTTTGGPTEGPVPTEEPEPTATPVTPDKPTATPVTPDKPTATPVTPDKPTATPVTPDKPTATPVTPDKPTATPVTPDKPTATPVTPDEPTATPLPTATVAPIQKYVATVNVTGGKAVLKDANGNTYPLVEVSNPTEEPVPTATASTEEPTEAPATAKPTMPPLTEITESYTFIADDFNSAGTLPISEGTMLDNGKVYSPAGNNAATNKKSSEINGASHLNSMRLKGAQNSLVFKTAVDVAVTVYGNAHDSRVYAAGTTNGGVELGKGQTGSGVFTFNASAGTTVYLTAVNDADNSGGDLFIAGFTVEPTANAAAEDGAVQYLIPEGDVVTVDATPDTAGLYPIVTVKGADGQDIAVSDNKFTMPGQNVTTEVTFGDAPATATPAPTATVSPEPTATATVAPPTATPVFPSYANWNIGQAKIDTTDGAAAEVVYPAEGGKAAIEVTSRNIYTTFDQEVSAGQANVSLDVYIDPAVPKNFRIYLESGTENYQNPNGEYVFAEVANNNNSSVNYGPNPAEENKLFDYSQMTAGWYKFNITLDYEGTDFITLEVTAPDGTVAGTAKMGAIAGKSTALRQVRLIQTAAAAQFADMAITVSGQPTATPAPSTPSPTAVPVSSIVVPANDLTLDGGAVLSDNAGQNYTWTEKATDEMKSTFGDPIDSVNTAKFALMNGDGRNVSKTINIPADGEYKLMVMSIEYNNRYFTASVDNGAAIEPESQTPGKMATNNAGGSNVDLTVTEYNLGTLTNGEHTVKVISAANNSRNILAIAVVPVAAPATPDPSATPEPNKYIATVNVTGGTAVLKDAEGNVYPTYAPEATVAPTIEPSAEPSDAPTAEPSDAPTDEPAATATTAPVTPVTYKYTSTSEIKGGNLCEGDTCTFVDEASEEIRTLFADGSDAAKVAPALTANYKNYVGGTGSKASQPYIEGINLEPGTYNVYYLGYNNEVAIDATIGDISFSIPAASGVAVAREDNNASRVLKAYKFTFTAETALTNATLKFNTTEQWLPDIFSVILTNTTVAANAAGVDGAVQYLIPEGDVVTVDATAETAGQVASVTVTGADGQDVKVENNKFTMPGQNVTADITFAEAPATATPEATAAPTAKPAEVMIAGDMTLNGSAKVYNDAPKEPTAAYTEEYSNIFGENFSKAGTSKVGFLGSNFGGYVTKNYTIDETGSYKAYIMVSYAQSNNQFALSKDGTQVVQGTLVDKSEKVGTNGQDLFIYTYDIDNLEAGTYEFKYYSELGQCSDFVAAAIVAAEAPATATPAPATETPAPATATPEATEAPTPDPSATPSVRYTYTKGATTNGSFDVQNVSHPELVTKTADTANKVKWTAKNDLAKFENIVDPEPITVGDITIDPLNNATGGASDFWKHNTDTVDGISGNGNPRPSSLTGTPSDKDLPTNGTVLKLTSAKSGQAVVNYMTNAGKIFTVIEAKQGETTGSYLYQVTAPSKAAYTSDPIEMKVGYDYYVFVPASKIAVGYIEFTPYIETTEAFAGDTIKVLPSANDGYSVDEVSYTPENGNKTVVSQNAEGYTFSMPEANVEINVAFKEGAEPSETPAPTATAAPATETPEPTEAPATETPVPSATATPTEAPATETPAPTDAPVSTIAPIPAKGMTLPSGVNTTDKSSKVYNWNDKATDEMKAVFGDPLTGVNTEALVPMGAADRTISAKINVSAEQAGSYKLMVLGIEYSNRYYNVKVDSGNAIAPENTNPGKVALIDPTESNSDLTITTYDLGELTEGEHTISVISAANNSRDFFAMGFVKYTPAPATETPAPTEEPATATPEPSATAEPTEAPATETPAPSATAMPIDDYIKANIDDVNNQLVDGDVQYAQLVPNYDNSTVDVEVLDGTIKNMSVVKSIEAAIGLVNKYDPVAKYAVHYDGSDYATVSAANEAATNFDTVDNRPDGYKSYNPVTVFGKDDSPSAIAIGKAVSASLGLNTEQFNSISTTDLATFLGYLEANSKYSVNVTAYGADGNSIFTYKFIFADKQPVPTATAEPTATPEATATAAPIVVNMFDKSAVAISAGSQDTGLYWDNTKSGNMALIKSSVVGSFEGAQGIILREGTSGAVSVNVYKTKATTATDVDATQIATREIKMTGGYTPNYDNIISFEDGTTFESDDNILIKLSAIDHSSYCGNYSTCTISFDMPRYDIALDTFENGVASINSKSNPTVANAITKAAEGELVFVTATANADYELADVQYKGASESDYTKSASIAGAKTTAVAFEMPGEAATVKPIINALTYVTASISADNGSVTFTDGVASDTNRAITGKNVSFTVSANDGYAVESVKVMAGNDDVSSSVGLVENLGVYSFTTPLTDFTVTVNYIEAKAITVASVSNGSVSVENVTRPELIKKELNTAASVTWKAYDETANAIAANATDPDPITIDGVGVVDLPNNNDSATATDKKWTRGTSYKFDSSIGNFTGSISGGGNPRPSSFSGTPSATNLPAAGTVFEFTAAADGQMQIAYFAGSGKTLYLLESEPNADKGTQLATFTGANANAITDVFEVKAGNTYYFFGGATKAQYFGFKFVPYNYTILGVAGDTIKVNATPESGNYVVDTVTYATATEPSNSIPVVDNGDGYTFEMPNDAVTVNATFVNSII